MKKVSLLVTLLSSLAAMVAAPESALAQEWLVAARASVAGGIDVGGAEVAMRRARSVVSLGADLAVDERPKDIFGAAVIVEVEPKASFGGAARYGRLLGPSSLVFLSGEGLVAPHTLFGAGVTVVALVIALAACAVACQPEGSCIRYSDCANGETCASGSCVRLAEAPAAVEGPGDAAGASSSTAKSPSEAGASSSPVSDAGAKSDASVEVDAPTSVDAASDA